MGEETILQMKNERFFRHFDHSEKTIKRLSEVQYVSFQKLSMLIQLLIGAGFLYFGAFVIKDIVVQVLFLLFGSLLVVGLKEMPKFKADKIITLCDGKYPSSDISFKDDCIEVSTSGKTMTVGFDSLVRLVEDDQYNYMFISRDSAFMFPKQEDPSEAELKLFLSEKTSKEWIKVRKLLFVSFRSLFKERRNTLN